MVHGEESKTGSESTEDDAFLGIVGQGSTNLWETKARVNGIFIKFQIDTGPEVGWFSMSPLPRLHHHDIMTIVGLSFILTVPRQSSFLALLHKEKKKGKNSIPWP